MPARKPKTEVPEKVKAPATRSATAAKLKPAAAAKPAAAKKAEATAGAEPRAKAAPRPRKAVAPKVDPDQRRRCVEVAAYFIAEQRGFHGGCDVSDWVQAETEIDRMLREGLLSL